MNNLGKWHLVVFLSRKIILVETRYKIYDCKLYNKVKVLKTYVHYLRDYKYKVIFVSNNNFFSQFKDIKSLNS